ncbi:MAG: DUF4347 domain-containing protein, partial [Thermodesulfobacteriota bacterium]|nr:DUF4347 domain-containing protein [Thermodesulfobacteriota bacterium]
MRIVVSMIGLLFFGSFSLVFAAHGPADALSGLAGNRPRPQAGTEIVFIDASVMDPEEIIDDLGENAEVVRLTSGRNGVEEICDYLEEKENIAAIRIITHGNAGYFVLNKEIVHSYFVADNTDRIMAWGDALAEGGDILLYGCNLAATARGQALVAQIADLTGADVAAATLPTGGDMGSGENWDLDYHCGTIETAALNIQDYAFHLANQVVTNNNDSGAGSLRQAIADVGAGETITFSGDYTITLASQLTIDKSLTITGTGEGQTIIQANASPNTAIYRVFNITGTNVTLENMTIRHGKTSANGGGILINSSSTVNLNSCTVNANETSLYGGGITVYGTLNLTNTTVSENSATAAGGIYILDTSTTVCKNSTINSNTVSGYFGTGAAGICNGGDLTLTNSTISSNTATTGSGAGIYNATSMDVVNCTVSSNIAENGYGGGIYNDGTATILNSTICINTSGDSEETQNGYGGGIYHTGSSNVITVVSATIYNNDAASDIASGGTERGGGIYVDSGTTANILNSIIINNQLSVTGSEQNIYNSGTVNSYYGWLNNNSGTSIGGSNNNTSSYSVSDLSSPAYNGGFTNTSAVASAANISTKAGSGTFAYCNATDGYSYYNGSNYVKISDGGEATNTTADDQITTDQRGYYRTNGSVTRGAYQYNGVFAKKGEATSWTGSSDTFDDWSSAITACSTGDNKMVLAGTAIPAEGVGISKTITIQGAGADSTFVQAAATAGTASNRVFTITNGSLTVTLEDMTIRHGKADNGGGIYMHAFIGPQSLHIQNIAITNNVATSSGGGIYSYAYSDDDDTSNIIVISNSTISKNSAVGMGGGIYNAGLDGNCYAYADLSINNATISGNTSGLYGGGIYNGGDEGYLTIRNSTIANNHSDNDDSGDQQGGGIYSNGGTTAANTIIANNYRGSNTATGDDYYYHSGILIDNGYNVVKYQSGAASGTTKTFTATTDILYNTTAEGTAHSAWNQNSSDLANQNLNLSSTLALNGSINGTDTLALSEGSFAAASAATGIPPASNWNSSPQIDGQYTDQRGVVRTADQNTGIGAYSQNYIVIIPDYYYRIKTDGAWNAAETWEQSVDGSVWTDADAAPDDSSLGITIQDGNTVTVTADVTIDQTTVESGATLTINSGVTLTIANGDGTDLTVTGTLTNSGTITCAAGSTVMYDGTTGQDIVGALYNELALSGSGTKTFSGTTTATGGITIDADLTVTGDGAGSTIVQASATEGTATDRVFTIDASATVTIQDLTIRHGKADGNPARGGGVYNLGTCTMERVTVAANHAQGAGQAYGGGICNSGTLTMVDSTITGNTAVGADSGQWAYGGGIFTDSACTLTLSGCLINENSATGGDGGSMDGGAAYGGGLSCPKEDATGTIDVVNCTISGNSVFPGSGSMGTGNANGGGIYAETDHRFSFCTIAGNSARYGGGILTLSTGADNHGPVLKACIVADNSASDSAPDIYGRIQSRGYNLIEDTTDLILDIAGNGNTGVGNITGTDPALNALADNGGPTRTMAIAADSQARDGADTNTDISGAVVTTDQRGFDRNGETDNDIGAFEYLAPTVTTQAVTDIGLTTATGNGTITDLGYEDPTQHGVCWSTNESPTTSDSKTE